MLRFSLDDWSVLKKLFTNVNEIIDEIVIECNDNGLKFNGMDRGHFCFFQGMISKELFDEYELDNIMELYIDLEDFVKVLKRGKNSEVLVFEADIEVYKVKFKDRNTRTFEITQISDITTSKTPPNLDYLVDFECDYDSIKNSLVDADFYSDRIVFDFQNGKLVLSNDGSKGNYISECNLISTNSTESCSSAFTVSWLLKIFNTKLGSNSLKIRMGQDFPMFIGMGLENIEMNYLLAPRLGNDD